MIRIAAIDSNNQLVENLSIHNLNFKEHNWCWIDFNSPSEEEIQELSHSLHFHPLAIEDCVYSMQRPKLDYYDDFSFFVTHLPGPEAYNEHEIDFFLGENYIVTFHYEDLEEVNETWKKLQDTKMLDQWDIYKVFYEVMDNVVDDYFPILAHLEDEINLVEENPNDEPMDQLLERLFELRHQLLELRHAINPLSDLFYRILYSHRLQGIQDRREYFMDIYDHLLRLSEMANSNREITNDIRDNFISINSYQQNKVIQVLTVITSIFAPLTFIAGIYGMNFDNMPELHWHYGYPIAMVVMLLITVVMIVIFKKRGWFG